MNFTCKIKRFDDPVIKDVLDEYSMLKMWATFSKMKHVVITVRFWDAGSWNGDKNWKAEIEINGYISRRDGKMLDSLLTFGYKDLAKEDKEMELPF